MVDKKDYVVLRMMLARKLVSDPMVLAGMIEKLLIDDQIGRTLGEKILHDAMTDCEDRHSVNQILERWDDFSELDWDNSYVNSFTAYVNKAKKNRSHSSSEINEKVYADYHDKLSCIQEIQLLRLMGERIPENNIRAVDQLYVECVNEIDDIAEVEAVFLELKSNLTHKSAIPPVLEKWEQLFLKIYDIEQINIIEYAKSLYSKCNKMKYNKFRSKVKNAIVERWNCLCIENINDIKTVAGAKAAYTMSPKSKLAAKLILKKWSNLCIENIESIKTVEQIKALYEISPKVEDVRSCILEKWYQLFSESAHDIKTLRQADELLMNSPDNIIPCCQDYVRVSGIRDKLFLETIDTIERARSLYYSSAIWSYDKDLILKKWDQLCIDRVDSIKTIKQADREYKNAPDEGRARFLILEKCRQLRTDSAKFIESIDEVLDIEEFKLALKSSKG